jgi:hypothetical protein
MRRLPGMALAMGLWLGGILLAGAAETTPSDSSATSTTSRPCAHLDSSARLACQDSVIQVLSRRDSILSSGQRSRASAVSDPEDQEDDVDAVDVDRRSDYFFAFLGDWRVHGMEGDDFAKALYVIAAVVVVGGTLFYLPVMAYKLARNEQRDPIHHEFALAFGYSGGNWEGGGYPLYRNTYMPGMRYSLLVAHPVVALGLTVEGGYLASEFEESLPTSIASELRGAYGLIGPVLRFGAQAPLHFSLEFLNGVSTAEAIGWVSKARANVQMNVGDHLLLGVNAGSLFYDMHFFDGAVWREGSFNRDLSLSLGLETGFRF